MSFLVKFNKSGENRKIINQMELFSTLGITKNLTQSEIDNFKNQ